MTLETIITNSFNKNVIIHCPTYEDARYFLTAYWYRHYHIELDDMSISKNKSLAKAAISTMLYGYTRFGENTCYNISNGDISPISLDYITKYGLNYDFTLITNKDIQRTDSID